MARYITVAIAAVLYLVSLALPAFDLEQGDDTYYLGVVVLLFGGFSLDPRWLANPLWLAGVLCLSFKLRLAALLTLAAASGLALLCLTYVGAPIARDASGTDTTILQMGLGYYLWLGSMLVPTAFALYFLFQGREAPDAPPQLTGGDRE